jgi:hypothetical protein
MNIQRWAHPLGTKGCLVPADYEDSRIKYVTYADHVAALAQAEQRAYDDRKVYSEAEVDAYQTKYYEQGQRDALAAAVQRVEAYVAEVMSVPGLDADVYDVIAAIKGGAE